MSPRDLELLGITWSKDDPLPSLQAVKDAYHARAFDLHPDRGGSAEEFNQLHQAYGRVVEGISNPAPRRCKGCRGKGKVPKTRGFHVINEPCGDCRGKGTVT